MFSTSGKTKSYFSFFNKTKWIAVVVFLGLISIFVLFSVSGFGQNSERKVHILAFNDTYRIGGLYNGTVGGPARVRSLRKEMEEEYGSPILLLHAGDILFPSFLSREYEGEQMVDILNMMDGDPERFDQFMFVTLGNHEFDEDDPLVLQSRLNQSGFSWFNSNVEFVKTAGGIPLVDSKKLLSEKIVFLNGIKIGLFGLTIDNKTQKYISKFSDPLSTAAVLTQKLRSQGAEVVIAVTHLTKEEDMEILKALCGAGLDLIVGGHDHEKFPGPVKCGKDGPTHFVLKADSDAASATKIILTLEANGQARVKFDFIPLEGKNRKEDPDVAKKVAKWIKKHAKAFCKDDENEALREGGCLDQEFGQTNVMLVAAESEIRSVETNFGNWVADRLLQTDKKYFDIAATEKARCEDKPKVAFINSGSLRLNQNINRKGIANTKITRRQFEELYQYDNEIVLIEISGEILQKIANKAASEWGGSGHWLQIAGFAFRHDGKGKATDLTLLKESGIENEIRVEVGTEICAVTSSFLVKPRTGEESDPKRQDGFTMLNPNQIVHDIDKHEANGIKFPRMLKQSMQEAFKLTLDPTNEEIKFQKEIEGRTCKGQDADPCKAIKKPKP
ncbi:MAG: metallophosphoesterase [Sphingomonadales bacterium]